MSLAVVACIFSLVGFESATALGGEARNPLRTVPRAVTWSLVLTGLFMVIMGYVEVYATRHYATPLSGLAAPLNVISGIYHVSYFRIPLSIGAMISFFSLSLSCLNAGARIICPMGEHLVFPRRLSRVHEANGTPHVAITAYTAVIFLIAAGLEVWTGPLNTFGDAGTLAAFGFLLAYFLTAIAAPFYLARRRELRARHVGFAVLAVLCLLVPTVGSFYPVPAFPTKIFPYVFLGYLAAGGAWLFAVSRRQPGLLADIETDLEQTLEAGQEHTAAARGAHPPASPGLLPGLVADAAD